MSMYMYRNKGNVQSLKEHLMEHLLNKLINAFWMCCPNIQHPPFLSHFLCSDFGVLYLREHHSSRENCMSLTE